MTSGIVLADPKTGWAVRIVRHHGRRDLLRVKAAAAGTLAIYFLLAGRKCGAVARGQQFFSADTNEEEVVTVLRRLLLVGPEFADAEVH
jgi:hypothetical protein